MKIVKSCLIVCNGYSGKKLLNRFVKLNKPRRTIDIIALDGASDFLKSAEVTPDAIIGDLDSITPRALTYFRKKNVTVRKIINQDKTDLEKGLDYALKNKYVNISIIGFTGGRFDHSLNNLSILKRYYRKAKIKIYDNEFEIFLISKSAEFKCRKGDVVSLIPLPDAKGIRTEGLKYPLKNESLIFGRREGALNEASAGKVKITIRSGSLLILKRYSGIV